MFNWFKRKVTNNKLPELVQESMHRSTFTEKQCALIDYLDNELVVQHPHTATEYLRMHVRHCQLPLQYQHLSVEALSGMLKKQIKYGEAYIPRSIAFFVEPDGTWTFVYAVRDTTGSSETCCKMFTECLIKTNNQR